jgi:hypothetical protein
VCVHLGNLLVYILCVYRGRRYVPSKSPLIIASRTCPVRSDSRSIVTTVCEEGIQTKQCLDDKCSFFHLATWRRQPKAVAQATTQVVTLTDKLQPHGAPGGAPAFNLGTEDCHTPVFHSDNPQTITAAAEVDEMQLNAPLHRTLFPVDQDLQYFLRQLRLDKFIFICQREEILSIDTLLMLETTHLQELGLKLGPRVRLQVALRNTYRSC